MPGRVLGTPRVLRKWQLLALFISLLHGAQIKAPSAPGLWSSLPTSHPHPLGEAAYLKCEWIQTKCLTQALARRGAQSRLANIVLTIISPVSLLSELPFLHDHRHQVCLTGLEVPASHTSLQADSWHHSAFSPSVDLFIAPWFPLAFEN